MLNNPESDNFMSGDL